MTNQDFIILGAGASGLMLAYRLSQDTFFDDKSILIIDKQDNKGNDRTWCYWEKDEGEWDNLIRKSWPNILFGSKEFSKTVNLDDYNYKMIRSEKLYEFLWEKIKLKSNISFVKDKVIEVEEHSNVVRVKTMDRSYSGAKVFNSIPDSDLYKVQDRYPVLQQHFVGWFIKTESNEFDDSVATFMDFTVAQKGNTRFMYVLPIEKNIALFEYTLFSETLLPLNEYEESIKKYLENKGIKEYEIIEKEKGSIPMTSYKFSKLNSKNILNIGTAGGWTKASTGYTFKNTTKKTRSLVQYLKQNDDLSKFHKSSKFWFYDVLFLDVLAKNNGAGSKLFASLFKKAETKTILRFLDEETNILDDLKIISSVPPKNFTIALLRRIF